MYDNVTVDELFNYLLKDAKQHKSQLLHEIEAGDLAADVLNSEVLAHNNVISDNVNPDNELDRLDNKEVFGDPYEDPDWLSSVTFEQIDDDDTAEQVLDNIKKGAVTRELRNSEDDDMTALHKYANKGDTGNILNVHLDRMLNNIRNNKNLTDDEKKDEALRLVFNLSTRGLNTEPVDIRLDQDDIADELDRAGLIDDYRQLDPTFLNRQHIKPGEIKPAEKGTNVRKRLTGYENWDAPGKEVPMSYISDKDGDIQLYTPSRQANTVFNIFTNALTNAIKAGSAPDTKDLGKYIQDTFTNKLKTMSYDDWEKEIALLRHPEIDLTRIRNLIDREQEPRKIDMPDDELSQHIITKVRSALAQYRNQGFEVSDSMINNLIRVVLAANDYEDLPEDLLTPEDYAEFVPDNPDIGKTAAELADSRLNRWHKDNKEQYKEYLAAKAGTVKPSNRFEAILNKGAKKEALKSIYKYVFYKYPLLGKQLKIAKETGDEKTFNELAPVVLQYRNILDFQNNTEGKRDLYNWAHVLLNDRMLKDYGIDKREHKKYDTTLNEVLKESRDLMQDDAATDFEKKAYEYLASADRAHKEALSDKSNDAYKRGGHKDINSVLATLPADMADRIKFNMEDN